MTGRRVLVFDAGLNMGDNLRSFGALKAFTQAHPELEVVCWLNPEIKGNIKALLRSAKAVTGFIEHPRSPQETYRINHELIKFIKATKKDWSWSLFPSGKGPDQLDYTNIIPTGEPWLSAKLLNNESLDAPETVNQGCFLADLLDLKEESVLMAQPLLGVRSQPESYITVGLCRPDPDDPKQLPQGRRDKVWKMLLDSGLNIFAVDYQDHSPPPQSKQVVDLRLGSLEEKIPTMNNAAFHVGSDGGLIHFAAACGCPTIGFYAGPGPSPGKIFGPWPFIGVGGEHVLTHSFDMFLKEIRGKTALLQGG